MMYLDLAKFTAYLTIVTGMFFLLTILYWQIYPYDTFELNTENAAIYPKEINPGGFAIVVMDYCKGTKQSAKVNKHLHFSDSVVASCPSTVLYRYPTVLSSFAKGCRTSEILVSIPESVTPGFYYLEFESIYQMNPIREEKVVFLSEVFEVKE